VISDLRAALRDAAEDGAAVALLRSVLSALPPEAQFSGRGGVEGLLSEPVSGRSLAAEEDGASAASEVSQAMDRGDLLAALAVGARVSLSLYDAHLEWALGIGDLEREQARDAAIRLHGIGLLAQRLFDGSTPERAGELLSYEAGRAMLAWFIAVEVVLPISTEDEPAQTQHLRDLMDQHGEMAIQELNHLGSRADREGGAEVIRAMLGVVGPVVGAAVGAVGGVAGAVRRALPELADNSQDSLRAERESLGVYTLLVARLLAEIEAEALAEDLPPPPPPAPQVDPAVMDLEAAILAARDRWDPAPLASAQGQVAQTEAALSESEAQVQAIKKELRTAKRRLSRTIDRRARMAEAPPAGQAEASAAVERGKKALKSAEGTVKKALRAQGTCEEGVNAAKAALKRRVKILAKSREDEAVSRSEVEALQTRIAGLREQDEAQIALIREAEVAFEQAQAQAVKDMEARLVEARTRLEAIAEEAPLAREALAGLDARQGENQAAFSDLAGSREEVADGLVLARESLPDQQAVKKDRAAIVAQAQVRVDAATEKNQAAVAAHAAAKAAATRADKVAAKARNRVDAAAEAITQAHQRARDQAAQVEKIKAGLGKAGLALRANQEAQVAMEAAAAAAREDAVAALKRALEATMARHKDSESSVLSVAEVMREIEARLVAHKQSKKALAKVRKSAKAELEGARSQREARMTLSTRAKSQNQERESALQELEGGLPTLVKASRKRGAAHAGAAARVVGARDVCLLAERRLREARAEEERCVAVVADIDGAISRSRAEIEECVAGITAAESSPVQRAEVQGEPLGVDDILAELKPTHQGDEEEDGMEPGPTWDDVPSQADASEDAATAMFTADVLKARLLKEQQEEEAAQATVMFTRDKKRVDELKVEVEELEEEEEATAMFSLEELKARGADPVSEDEDEDKAEDDDATVIFQRPTRRRDEED
jgi:hypothetical protein